MLNFGHISGEWTIDAIFQSLTIAIGRQRLHRRVVEQTKSTIKLPIWEHFAVDLAVLR